MSYVPLHAPQQQRALKTAFRRLVEAVGGIDAAASAVRVGKSQIAEYYNPQRLDVWAPVDVVAELEELAGEPIVTSLMAGMARCVLVPLPEVVAGDDAKAVAAAFCEAAEGSIAFMQAMGDGRLCDADKAIIAGHLHDIVREASRALAQISGPALPLRGAA